MHLYYNFTKFHQNWIKKSFINRPFFCSEFQSVGRIVKFVHSVLGWVLARVITIFLKSFSVGRDMSQEVIKIVLSHFYMVKKVWQPCRQPNFRLPAPVGQKFYRICHNFFTNIKWLKFFYDILIHIFLPTLKDQANSKKCNHLVLTEQSCQR